MQDISNIISAASFNPATWQKEGFASTMESLSKVRNFTISWDKDDGETWASVLAHKSVIAYVAVVIPVILYRSDYEETIISCIDKEICSPIGAEDFDLDIFSIETSLIPTVELRFGRRWSTNVNTQKFSVNQFWWTTV